MKKSGSFAKGLLSKNTSFQKAHNQNYGKKYFNEKVKVKSPDDLLGKNVEPNPEYQMYEETAPADKKVGFDWGGWEHSNHWTDYDMSYYSNSTTSSSTYYGTSSNAGYYYHPIQWGYFSKAEPTIGEAPEMLAPNSNDKTFDQYYEEFHKETQTFQELAKKQAQKIKEEFQHEMAEYQKKQELEQQKADMPIYSAEFSTARVFLQYYANLALQKPPPQLKPEQIWNVSRYLAATITCELRHRKRKCSYFWSRALFLWDMLDGWGIGDGQDRRGAGKIFLGESDDWDNFMVEQYLKLGAYIFGGSWEGGFGGWPWASVAWYAGDWVHNALTKKGVIPIMLWEKMLNAAHNNGRWMNKLGMGNVMGVLNMGANADPHFIADIAKKALAVENPNDFRRIIEKWTHCDLPGEKDKLELPNPGVIVEVARYRNSKASYIKVIKKQEEDAKAAKAEAALVLEAPDLAPVELGVSSDAEMTPEEVQAEKKKYSVETIHKAVAEAAKKAIFKEEAITVDKSFSELKEQMKKTIYEQTHQQQKIMAEIQGVKVSGIPKPGVYPTKMPGKKTIVKSILETGIKLPWKGPKSPLMKPKTIKDAYYSFLKEFHGQLFQPEAVVELSVEKAEGKTLEEILEAIPSPQPEMKPGSYDELKKAMQPSWKKADSDDSFTDAEVSVRPPKEGGTHEQVAAG